MRPGVSAHRNAELDRQEASDLRRALGGRAFLSFVEGVRYRAGDEADSKHVLAASEAHVKAVLAEFDAEFARRPTQGEPTQ